VVIIATFRNERIESRPGKSCEIFKGFGNLERVKSGLATAAD
jgi:hypothetical protein